MITFDKIGSDPEFFITDKEDSPIPAFLFFEGSKYEPEDMGNGFAILRDNLLVEGNVPPAKERQEFIDNMKMLKDLISAVLLPQKAKLTYADVMKYDDMWIYTPDGQEFGCSTYKDAYSNRTIATPILEGNIRSGGLHIHVSYKVDADCGIKKKEFNRLLTKAMDLFVGIPSDQVFHCAERRKFYGALGNFRDTKYGFEYRSLGAFFMQDKYLGWIYDQTMKAIDFCKEISNVEMLREIDSASIENYEKLGININEQVPLVKELA